MKSKTLFLILCGLLASCSSNKNKDEASSKKDQPFVVIGESIYPLSQFPTPPTNRVMQDLVIAKPAMRLSSPSPLNQSPVPTSDSSNFLSIMAQNGAVLTVWALAQRNWLWIYPPLSTQSFGNIRNWRLERFPHSEQFRFINQQLNSCMESYRNGLIHNQCAANDITQRFEFIPTTNGAVYIKSVAQQRCLTYNTVSNKGYFTLTLQDCRTQNNPLSGSDQTWYLAPPLLNAKTLN